MNEYLEGVCNELVYISTILNPELWSIQEKDSKIKINLNINLEMNPQLDPNDRDLIMFLKEYHSKCIDSQEILPIFEVSWTNSPYKSFETQSVLFKNQTLQFLNNKAKIEFQNRQLQKQKQ